MKKLPIGIQTFEKIRTGNYAYVDKTKILLTLVEKGQAYFLSRPRRFGKSLFLSTLKALFEGQKHLFQDLYIEKRWNWQKTYPVIEISFADGLLRTEKDIQDRLKIIFKENQRKLDVTCDKTNNIREDLRELIIKTSEKYQQNVVVLVDEYDKPMLDNISDPKTACLMRDILRDFYSVLKGADPYLHFVFLTGVSKFSKVSVFSGLNNLEDISLMPTFATICGYTQADLENTFNSHLQNVNMKRLKKWYNGYNFLGESIYNPFDILLFISNDHHYENYWFSTGTPTFLIELIKQQQYYLPMLDNLTLDKSALEVFDVDQMSFEAILFQTGYLTIKKVITKREEKLYRLDYPNYEVQVAFNNSLIQYLTQDQRKTQYKNDCLDALYNTDFSALERTLKALFASIPYQNFTNNTLQNYEGYYASIIYTYFKSFGENLIAEDNTNHGRIDLTLKIENKIYIFEFKVVDEDTSKNSAIQQIKEKGYADKYKNDNVTIYLVGIEFSREKRNIVGFEVVG
ncbi:MAG: ATP-binding protein [Methylococcales bacterium]|jgi:hypothetical protein|nr:ATP-binding protein [Methylococcales bacterium]